MTMVTKCIPYSGQLNEDWLPVTETGELFMEGSRSCKRKDCVNPDHVGKAVVTCSTPDCTSRPYATDLCNKHFYLSRKQAIRLINKQDVLEEIVTTWLRNETADTCSYEQCTRPFKAKGLCFTHYMSRYQFKQRTARKSVTDLLSK